MFINGLLSHSIKPEVDMKSQINQSKPAQNEMKNAGISLLAVLCVAPSVSTGAEFCVRTMDQLVVALSKAETNKQDDVIKLVKGEYINNFNYLADPNFALSLSGGYVAGCSRQVIGPGATILDGGQLSNTFYIRNSNGGNINFSNLTLRNAGGDGLKIVENLANITLSRVDFFKNGGNGIQVTSGNSFTVDRCQFEQNQIGIDTTGFDRLIVRNSTFKDNTGYLYGYKAAGVQAEGIRSVLLEKNTFTGNRNRARDYGYPAGAVLGGTLARTSSITVKNNTFDSNSGGLKVTNPNAEPLMGLAWISGNTFINNSISGLYAEGTKTIKIHGNVLYWNNGLQSAILARNANNIDVQNNVVANNVVDGGYSWPAVGVDTARDRVLVKVINNTITANERTNTNPGGGGLGLWLFGNLSKALIYNNIVYNNKATLGADMYINNDADGDLIRAPVELFNNNFNHTRNSGFHVIRYIPINASNLNNINPVFKDAAKNDFHLTSASPMLDKGSAKTKLLLKTDYEGDQRVLGPAVDIGADEYKP
jgi:hypothetical protein